MAQIFLNLKNRQGVTLVETIVSLGILTIGIVAALSLMISSISYSQSTEQTIVVVNLAREGIEIVRSIRDLNGWSGIATGVWLPSINYVSGDLQLIAADNTNVKECGNCQLRLYEGRYLYNSPGADTFFKRSVTINDVNEHEKNVVSRVYWVEHGREHYYNLETNLTDW